MTKSFKNFALAVALTFASFGAAFAGPGGKKAKSLSNQIHELIAYPEVKAELSGEAVIFFTVKEDESIEVKGVFGTNEELIDHIETALKDKSVELNGLDASNEFQVKVKFSDYR